MGEGMLNIDRLIRIARDTVKSSSGKFGKEVPLEIEELLIGVMVGMYLKGFKHGLKSIDITAVMLGKDIQTAEAELSKLYNLER